MSCSLSSLSIQVVGTSCECVWGWGVGGRGQQCCDRILHLSVAYSVRGMYACLALLPDHRIRHLLTLNVQSVGITAFSFAISEAFLPNSWWNFFSTTLYGVWSLECGVWIWVCEEIERWPTSLEAARTTVLNFKFVYYQSIRILSKSKVTSGKFENYSGQFFCPRTNGPGAETNHHRFFFFFYIFLIFSFFFFPVSFFPLLLNFNLILDSGVYERHKFSGSKLRCFLQT